MNEVNKQTIELYAKQLRVPSFNRYPDVIKQLNKDQGYDDFLVALMKLKEGVIKLVPPLRIISVSFFILL